MQKNNGEIQFYNRNTKAFETEKIYGDGFVKFLYQQKIGKYLSPIFATKTLSKIYGGLQDLAISKNKVPPFVKKFSINLDQYEAGSLKTPQKENSYANFNEFFIRKFEDGQRKFVPDENKLGAFAEARYVGFESISESDKFPVKGSYLHAKDILQNEKYAKDFEGGPLLIARLCPVDYHRYHYPCDGKTLKHYFIHGDYHSVNPIALKSRPEIFIRNERRVSILETKNFGKLAYVEVGAVCVGKIIQTHNETIEFRKGDEKGYFLFGGSTVILIGEKGKFSPSADIIQNTKNNIETYITLGDEIASI